MKKLKKFLYRFRYEDLNDVNKYSLDYLYNLLRGNSSTKIYYRHMTWVHRGLSAALVFIFLLSASSFFVFAAVGEWRLLVAVAGITISFIVASGNSIDTNYREQVKAQIEYRKYLADSSKKPHKKKLS